MTKNARWRQGTTLATRQTERWSAKKWEENEALEKLRVYDNFHESDEGQSRRLVGVFEDPKDAELAACAPELLGALRFILAFYEPGQTHLDTEAWKVAEASARRIVARAEGR